MYVTLLVTIFSCSVAVVSSSESAQCLLNRMSGRPLNDTRIRDTAASRLVRRSVDEDGPCGVPKMMTEWINSCPKDKASDVVLPMLDHFSEKYCTSGSNETALRQFIMETREFSEKWAKDLVSNSCLDFDILDITRTCKVWSECTFGKALDMVKDNFSEDVVAFSVDTSKFANAVFAEAILDKELPQACDVLFEPYKRDGRQ